METGMGLPGLIHEHKADPTEINYHIGNFRDGLLPERIPMDFNKFNLKMVEKNIFDVAMDKVKSLNYNLREPFINRRIDFPEINFPAVIKIKEEIVS